MPRKRVRRKRKRGGVRTNRRTRCKSCRILGYGSVARRHGGACSSCGGNFFTNILGHIANGIKAIGRWRASNNYPEYSSFPAAIASRSAYKPVNPLSYTYLYNAY